MEAFEEQTYRFLDLLQFAYQEKVGEVDAILYLPHRVYSHVDKGSGAVRIIVFDCSSTFNTPATEREARKYEGGLTPGVLDHRLPYRETKVYQT